MYWWRIIGMFCFLLKIHGGGEVFLMVFHPRCVNCRRLKGAWHGVLVGRTCFNWEFYYTLWWVLDQSNVEWTSSERRLDVVFTRWWLWKIILLHHSKNATKLMLTNTQHHVYWLSESILKYGICTNTTTDLLASERVNIITFYIFIEEEEKKPYY